MTEQAEAHERHDQSTALAVRESAEAGVPLPPMDDRELAATFRTAKALADSGLFKDATKAGQAFAKIVAGRDLGLSPFESMSALHVIEGKIEASADLHATKVRQREGFDFRVAWLKQNGDSTAAVWADEEDLADLRPVVGCAIAFYDNVPPGGRPEDGRQRGVSRWTREDTERANLQRDRGGKKSPHEQFPRNMYYARAMTNGVAWYVPEVMGGVRVYGLGEAPRELGVTEGEGTGEAPGVPLPTEVEAIIARARTLGHAGLADRATAEMTLAGQPPERVAQWCQHATKALNAMAAGRPQDRTEPEPVDVPDADVVDESEGAAVEAAVQELRERAGVLMEQADAEPDEDAAEALRARALETLAEAEAAAGEQGTLDVEP